MQPEGEAVNEPNGNQWSDAIEKIRVAREAVEALSIPHVADDQVLDAEVGRSFGADAVAALERAEGYMRGARAIVAFVNEVDGPRIEFG